MMRLLSIFLLASTFVHAEVLVTTESLLQVDPPASVVVGNLESDSEIYMFEEQETFMLPEDVGVNILVSDLPELTSGVQDPLELTPGMVPQGTLVDSYLIHSDRMSSSGSFTISGSVTFSAPIIGVIVMSRQLNDSDPILGAVGTEYPTGNTLRDLELGDQDDAVWLTDEGHTLHVIMELGRQVDHIRVLVDASQITPVREIPIDIRPGACLNPLNLRSRGVIPVAILGADDFDVLGVDQDTILIEGVQPIRVKVVDIASPNPLSVANTCTECFSGGPDGFPDLLAHFDTQELAAGLEGVEDRECVMLLLSASMLDGTPLGGQDRIAIRNSSR